MTSSPRSRKGWARRRACFRGGSGNNRGAILGPILIWTIWSTTELLTRQLPGDWALRSAYLRVFLIGLALQIILQRFSQGLLKEQPPKPIPLDEEAKAAPAGGKDE